eukprot:CAMPEP_0177701524 /NCGR_PEP_ID=MMETSP0484_2-20121128/6654_1 /TAXON_ID=354590 /ORGANISM="Rhodomonas lens, Strain RHODO" /LENGTH=147 /DNA_ID=CAMNT_0019212757 /DNA_START=80 /DNA_END=519 /DNA_ORIENTATION=+
MDKKELVEAVQSIATPSFLQDHNLNGSVAAVAKRANKDKVIVAYNQIYDGGLFRQCSPLQDASALSTTGKKGKSVKLQRHEGEGIGAVFETWDFPEGLRVGAPASFTTEDMEYTTKWTGTIFEKDGNVVKVSLERGGKAEVQIVDTA